jgi:hypothetical protein
MGWRPSARRITTVGFLEARSRTTCAHSCGHASSPPRRAMKDPVGWHSASREHDLALRSFVKACERIPSERWRRATSSDGWSPAEVVVHVCHAYELGRDSAAGGPGMRLLVTPRRAWALRTLLLPVILSTGRFPRGVPAPREVVPDRVMSRRRSREELFASLARVARQALDELRIAAEQRPNHRIMHAYFGALTPLDALRLLSAHTRHHARRLASRVR